MLFWLFIIILFIGVSLFTIGICYDNEFIGLSGGVVATLSVIVIFIMLALIISNHCGVDAQVAKNQEIYEALNYKLESGACRDEFGLLNKSIIDEIQDWNEDVVYYQNIQDNFWLGIFYPDVFDQFETIDYERYSTQNN